MREGIREVKTKRDSKGNYKSVSIIFGPHFFVDILHKENGKLKFVLGFTHHGFIADASKVDDELEKIIEKVRELYPDKRVD